MITIRAMERRDAEAVSALASQFEVYLNELREGRAEVSFLTREVIERDAFGASPAFSGLVAEEGGKVVGYLLYYPGYITDRATRIMHMPDLFVAESHRGKGAGQALLEGLKGECRRYGATKVLFTVWRANPRAVHFYHSVGAVMEDDEVMMSMEVDGPLRMERTKHR